MEIVIVAGLRKGISVGRAVSDHYPKVGETVAIVDKGQDYVEGAIYTVREVVEHFPCSKSSLVWVDQS